MYISLKSTSYLQQTTCIIWGGEWFFEFHGSNFTGLVVSHFSGYVLLTVPILFYKTFSVLNFARLKQSPSADVLVFKK